MNVVVIGGSETGKFGNDLVRQLRNDAHTVKVLSHRKRDEDAAVANFTSLENVIECFNELVKDINSIDILVYNSSINAWPNSAEHYKKNATIKENLYQYGFKIHAVIPHAIAIEALNKMTDTGRIVFVTTDMIYDKARTEHIDMVGYAGGKSYQHHLMLALAKYSGVTVSSISPFFDYANAEKYKQVFNKTYKYVVTHNKEYNGKVFDCWD